MDAFLNMLKTLHCIDGWDVETFLSEAQTGAFLTDPVKFFLKADDPTQEKIWAIVAKYQAVKQS
jgi:hypothetical protein